MIATSPAIPPETNPSEGGLPVDPAGREPGERADRGSRVRDQERIRRDPVRCERAPRVEPEPAEPEQAGAEQGHGDVRRLERILSEADALADHECERERTEAGADVDDSAPREVERTHCISQPPPQTQWASTS